MVVVAVVVVIVVCGRSLLGMLVDILEELGVV